MKFKRLAPVLAAIMAMPSVLAVCPICTVFVAAGTGVLRAWGIDDSVTGLWYGGLIVSSTVWLIDWMTRRHIRFPFRGPIIAVAMYGLFVLPLYPYGIIGLAGNTLFGIDRFMLGIVLGSLVFLLAMSADSWMRRHTHEAKALFAYQTVVIPVVFLLVVSFILHYAIKILRWYV